LCSAFGSDPHVTQAQLDLMPVLLHFFGEEVKPVIFSIDERREQNRRHAALREKVVVSLVNVVLFHFQSEFMAAVAPAANVTMREPLNRHDSPAAS